MGTVVAVQTLSWPNSHIYLPPKYTAAKARPVSVVGSLIVLSGILQLLGFQVIGGEGRADCVMLAHLGGRGKQQQQTQGHMLTQAGEGQGFRGWVTHVRSDGIPL